MEKDQPKIIGLVSSGSDDGSSDSEFVGEPADVRSRKGDRVFWLLEDQRKIAELWQKRHGCGELYKVCGFLAWQSNMDYTMVNEFGIS